MRNIKKEKKRKETKRNYFLLIFVLIYFVQRIFFESSTLNQPFFLYGIVFSVSVLSVLIFKRTNFKIELEKINSMYIKTANILGIFLECVIINFVILISTFLLVFGIINKVYASHNPIEYFSEKITQITDSSKGGGRYVQFYFMGKYNSVILKKKYKTLKAKVSQGEIEQILISCRKGLLGTYIIEDYSI